MFAHMEMSADVKPKKTWRMFLRRQKISHCEARAAPQEAEEHRDSCAGPGAQAAAEESRAAAPHSPRARGRALLHSLRRGSRAILSRVAAVLRRHSQQRGTPWHPHQGTEAGTVAPAPAAGARNRAAAPHGPCSPIEPSPGQLGAIGGQGAGAAVGAVLAPAEHEENAWFSLEQDGEVDSLKELYLMEDHPEDGCSGEQRPPVRPRQAWVEHGKRPSLTDAGQASALPSAACHSWPEVSTSQPVLGGLCPSPCLRQVEARRQRTTAAARLLLPGQPSEQGDTSEDVQAGGRADQRGYVSWRYEPQPLEPCKGTRLLGLSPSNK
ncbi:hypothetical protein DUI87_14492 [Hirundo rustica rustica]|uniref:Uncharacterized protein n=1 Tax=Hirundo rustica rustica TaxID=333673 RepID=A0A3M0K6S7_HIRRU|nr:hypothetical protein DUI87_14492 [Hirundo rustica rustica]